MASEIENALISKLYSLQRQLEAADNLQRPRLIASVEALKRLRARGQAVRRLRLAQGQYTNSFPELAHKPASDQVLH